MTVPPPPAPGGPGADPSWHVGAEHRRYARQRLASRSVQAVRTRLSAQRSFLDRLADALTAAAGSAPFLAAHLLWFAVWIAWNEVLARRPFDPYPFGFLTLVVSLEAIVLTIFVLMSQRRESRIAELREELTLEVDLRTEEEVTKTLQLVVGLYGRLGFPLSDEAGELLPMLEPLDQEDIARQLAGQMQPPRRRRRPTAVDDAPATPANRDPK